MSTLERGVRLALLSDTELSAHVGSDRVYSSKPPDRPSYPMIVLAIDSRGSIRRHGGGLNSVSMDLAVWSDRDVVEARLIGDKVRAFLLRRRHIFGGVSFIFTDCQSAESGAIDRIDIFGDEIRFDGFYSSA